VPGGFTAHPLFSAAAATGAALLWQAKNNAALPVLERLPNGFLSRRARRHPRQVPADELAALYAQRWEIESIFDELKTHQRGPRVILRSRTPEGVYQEAWGYLCVHYALRALIQDAADQGDLDPDRISFTKTLHAARRSVRTGLSGTVNLATALHRAISEILHPLLPKRRLRANARVVRRKMSNYNVKRAAHRAWPTPTLPIGSAIRILSPP
jgi:hypothetical protein